MNHTTTTMSLPLELLNSNSSIPNCIASSTTTNSCSQPTNVTCLEKQLQRQRQLQWHRPQRRLQEQQQQQQQQHETQSAACHSKCCCCCCCSVHQRQYPQYYYKRRKGTILLIMQPTLLFLLVLVLLLVTTIAKTTTIPIRNRGYNNSDDHLRIIEVLVPFLTVPIVHGWKIRNFFPRKQFNNNDDDINSKNKNGERNHDKYHRSMGHHPDTESLQYESTALPSNNDDDTALQQHTADKSFSIITDEDGDINERPVIDNHDKREDDTGFLSSFLQFWTKLLPFDSDSATNPIPTSHNDEKAETSTTVESTTTTTNTSPTLAPTILSADTTTSTTGTEQRLLDRINMIRDVLRTPLLQFYDILQQHYQVTKEQCRTIVYYRPPVGLVSLVLAVRILLRSKQYLYHHYTTSSLLNDNVEDQLFLQKLQQKKKDKEKRYQRAYLFNQDDVAYHYYGGVERIRTRLCLAGLHSIVEQQQSQHQHQLHHQRHMTKGVEISTTNSAINNKIRNADSQQTDRNNSLMNERTDNLDHVIQRQVPLLIKLLSVSCTPKMSWIQYIYEMIIPLAQLEEDVYHHQDDKERSQSMTSPTVMNNNINSDSRITTTSNNEISISSMSQISLLTGQVRLHDALLRLCRDRVLQTTYRLARTVEHWERRLKYSTRRSSVASSRFTTTSFSNINLFLQKLFRIHSIDNDRLCLSLAKAAYKMEVTKLGEITALLMERPYEMEETNLVYALKDTEQRRLLPVVEVPAVTSPSVATTSLGDTPTSDEDNNVENVNNVQNVNVSSSAHQRSWSIRQVCSKVYTAVPSSLRNFSKYSFRWKADGKGFLSIRKFDNNSDGYIDGESACNILIHGKQRTAPLQMEEKSNERSSISQQTSNDIWMKQANEWIRRVQKMICEVIRDSIQSSTAKSLPNDCSPEQFETVQSQWCNKNNNVQFEVNSSHGTMKMNREQQYRSIVNYIDSSSSWRKIGEGEKIRLRDVFGMKDWITRLDVLGIPSSIFCIYVAYEIHKRIIVPYWAVVRKHAIEISEKALEILQQRVWVPLKGIYDDIMNRSPSMMSALGLDIEETSLDHMLRDLNFGDGTPATRQEAIRKATEQYEHDLSHGLFANFARGRLIRLLLIQVQQLKVGMLSALETIDVLMVGNQIHFKVLAAIPAIVIATLGTRYFIRGLYNIRAKDIRPISAVHHEMAQYLNKIEKILILSDPTRIMKAKNPVERQNTRTSNSRSFPDNASNSSPDQKIGDNDVRSSSFPKMLIGLTSNELGEMVLNIHRYLILLDFSSPQPFPTNQCDEIHTSLQQFYNKIIDTTTEYRDDDTSLLDCTRQVQWLHTIQQKHQELMKFL